MSNDFKEARKFMTTLIELGFRGPQPETEADRIWKAIYELREAIADLEQAKNGA